MKAAAVISAAWCLLVTGVTLSAQIATPQTAAASQTPKPKAGHVRLWNMVFVNSGPLELVIGAGSTARVIQNATVANTSASYDPLPLGHYILSVFHAGDRQTPLKNFNVDLRDKSYFTVLALSLPGGQPSFELIDDTPDPTKPPSNRLTVRQTCFILHGIVVNAGNQHTDPMEPGAVQTLENLPEGLVPVAARAVTPKGPKTYNADVDFRLARHATLFVIADSYSRLRLRPTADGPSPAEEAEAAAEAKGTP